jgi:hypothetical protein
MEAKDPPTYAYAIFLLIVIATAASCLTIEVAFPSPGYPFPPHFEWLEYFGSRQIAVYTFFFVGVVAAKICYPRPKD